MYIYNYTTEYDYKADKYICTTKLCHVQPIGIHYKTTTIKEEVISGIRPSNEMRSLIHKYNAVGRRIPNAL